MGCAVTRPGTTALLLVCAVAGQDGAVSSAASSSSFSSSLNASASNASLGEPCVVVAPAHGGPGDCPALLPSGVACRPSCQAGYNVTSLTVCDNGNLTLAACLPRSCAKPQAPMFGTDGNCTSPLAHGQWCQPTCNLGYQVSGPTVCNFGIVSSARCELSCSVGMSSDGITCTTCPDGTYKDFSGPGLCTPCMAGSNVSKLPRTARTNCYCHSSVLPNRSDDGSLMNCFNCPNNSKPYLGGNTEREPTLEDCQAPCNLVKELDSLKITGNDEFALLLNTCVDPQNNNSAKQWLDGGETCSLSCKEGTAPQVGSDIFKAPDLRFRCQNGQLQGPPMGTWCSKASWEVPPLVFLATVSVATLVAGCGLEIRQQRWERECARALASRVPHGYHSRYYADIKYKVA